MDFDHPDDEPPRPVTPRPGLSSVASRGRIGSRSLFLMNLSSLMEPRNHHPWMATHIGPGASTGAFMIQPLAKMREVQFMYGGPSFGNLKIGFVKGIDVSFQDRTPLTPAWALTRLSHWMRLVRPFLYRRNWHPLAALDMHHTGGFMIQGPRKISKRLILR